MAYESPGQRQQWSSSPTESAIDAGCRHMTGRILAKVCKFCYVDFCRDASDGEASFRYPGSPARMDPRVAGETAGRSPNSSPLSSFTSRAVVACRLPCHGTMSSEKSTAIVLRVTEFSESSAVVTLFTRDWGKISALAKGVRRPKSSFDSAIDLLSVCRIVFLHKSSDALDLLTEAKLERRFRACTRNLSRLYAGYYVAELLNKLTDEGDPYPEVFDCADATLLQLDGDSSIVTTLLRFELTVLRLLGHLPALAECAGCGQALEHGRRVAFGQLEGGVLCALCRPGKRQVVSVSAEGIELMQSLISSPTVTSEALTATGEVRGLMAAYISNLLGQRPQMHRYLGIDETRPRDHKQR